MRNTFKFTALVAAVAMLTTSDLASAQTWANWTSGNTGSGTMSGTLGSTTIAYSGGLDGYQLSDGITRTAGVTPSSNCSYAFYCLPQPYTSAGVVKPTNSGFIQYTRTYTGTITFGTAVTNPLIAFISVGQPGAAVRYDFGGNAFTMLSSNTGNAAAWGPGTYSVAGNVLTGNEFSGVIRLNGTFNSFNYSVLDAENWHGLTVGVQEVGVLDSANVVPEPSTYALMGAGLLALGIAAGRRRRPDAKDKLFR
ncbi:MAG: PEP-CTERM sorting domain-containing protein [Gemmatimonadaceae bacterium]